MTKNTILSEQISRIEAAETEEQKQIIKPETHYEKKTKNFIGNRNRNNHF